MTNPTHNLLLDEDLMNFKELTAAISKAENIPAGAVRKSCRALLERMATAIEAGENMQLPSVSFSTRTLPYRPDEGDKKERLEEKIARLRVKSKKENDQDVNLM